MTSLATVASGSRQVQRKLTLTRTPPSWLDILDGATVTFRRFDDRGGEGVNFIEVRLKKDSEPTRPEGERDAR